MCALFGRVIPAQSHPHHAHSQLCVCIEISQHHTRGKKDRSGSTGRLDRSTLIAEASDRQRHQSPAHLPCSHPASQPSQPSPLVALCTHSHVHNNHRHPRSHHRPIHHSCTRPACGSLSPSLRSCVSFTLPFRCFRTVWELADTSPRSCSCTRSASSWATTGTSRRTIPRR